MKHKTELLNTGSTKLQENNATTLELPLNYRKNESNTCTNENHEQTVPKSFWEQIVLHVLADTDADGTRI